MKVRCGDANPGGNVWMLFKGGCGKELDITEAYRCTGCGGWFHLDCIYKHFELEEKHDTTRKFLAKIKRYAVNNLIGNAQKYIIKMADRGLDRQLENRRVKIKNL